MLQLLAKGDDIFTGGREYYSHPNYKGADKPTIIHQSSATGMQAIPTPVLPREYNIWKQSNSSSVKKGQHNEKSNCDMFAG